MLNSDNKHLKARSRSVGRENYLDKTEPRWTNPTIGVLELGAKVVRQEISENWFPHRDALQTIRERAIEALSRAYWRQGDLVRTQLDPPDTIADLKRRLSALIP